MKNKSLKEKFKNNILVRPLYKKFDRKVRPNKLAAVNVDGVYKLEGDAFNVKGHNVVSVVNGEVVNVNTKKVILPGLCENVRNESVINKVEYNRSGHNHVFLLRDPTPDIKMLDSIESETLSDNNVKNKATHKLVQVERVYVSKNFPDIWLRVFPLPKLPKETVCSVLIRCAVCQIGLATIIILWTLIWTFIIQTFEGPYELQVSVDFEREQNQLVIDLATELRQITPLSPKWRIAIENRLQDERQLTMVAVGKGARAHAGQFWNLPGTFLFTVYVMTALGFGAPVPHTVWGRSSALIYAIIAVPTHIYLMVNASTCIIVYLEDCCCRRKKIKINDSIAKNASDRSQTCNRNSEFMKISKHGKLRKNILNVLCLPCACRCVPLAAILYYACGAIAFGVLRDLPAMETFMFPLEFTTTGGLEHVQGYVRILYGMYVEGAMVLLSCALATLKRHSSASANSLAETYRLFQVEGL